MEVWKTDNKDELVSGRLDGTFDLASGFFTAFGIGVEIKDREKTFERSAYLPFITPTEIPSGMSFEVSVPGGSEFSSVLPFLGMDTLAVASALFPPVDLQITESIAPSNWIISEKVTAGYIQADFGNEPGDRGFSGNIGVRFVRTKIKSASARLENGVLVDDAHTVTNDYSDTLPSLNLSYWFDENQRARFAAGEVMARPPLDDLGSGVARWGVDDFGGNPMLEPFRANQLDLAYERYFADAGGALSIGVFYKDLDTFIVQSQVPNEVGGTFTQPFNGTGGTIKGAEFALIRSLDFLPAPFNGLGVNLNYTYLDSDVEWNTPWSVESFTLPGLSEDIANAVIWYERGGFSTRLSYRYRGPFVSSGANAEGDVYARSEDLLDFEASYQFDDGSVVDGMRLMFQVNNINDTPFRTFYEFEARRGQYEVYGRTVYAGLQYAF
jgi:TonB-dependent receptor